MASYPASPKAYPASPKAYPASPKAYPNSLSSYPLSVSNLDAPQSFVFEVVASKLDPLLAPQGFVVNIVASKASIPAAQMRVEVATAAVTLGGTMRASGTTPPVVLLKAGSQSLTFGAGLCPGFYVDILVGGLTFSLSFNSGSTFAFTAQTIPVGGGDYTIPSGTYAGMIITFPLGTYNADNLYEGTVETIRTTEGNSYTFTNATVAQQPVFRDAAVTPDAKDGLFWNGAQALISTDAAVIALFTNDPALTVMFRVAYATVDATTMVLCACRSDDSSNRQRRWGNITTGNGRETHLAVNDAGTSTTNTCTTDPLTGTTNVHTVGWFFPGSNGGASIRVNDSAESLTVATLNVGTLTPTRVVMGAEGAGALGSFQSGYTYDLAVFSSSLSGADATGWFAEMA